MGILRKKNYKQFNDFASYFALNMAIMGTNFS